MRQFYIEILPPLPVAKILDLHEDSTLDVTQFDLQNTSYVCNFVFGDVIISYGQSTLYQIYIDICDEFDKIYSGESHDLEFSFYPMARILIDKDQVSVVNVNGELLAAFHNELALFSREQMLTSIKEMKRHIESFVLGAGVEI
ncbi:hypothetical protein [Sphingomonas elodea]|uniref:hypothetical protein n=1 Tax=Sphingomonas elodea TaxID=179878 RepID=UPI0011103869|nr:hypothetical protein [Sphingomonas elodea]